jgi:hypothetical protein
MKILITESQYNKLNKSSQLISNTIIKYMNGYVDGGERKVTKKSRNYGNLREDWCINGKETISAFYYFEKGEFERGSLSISKKIVENLSNLLSIRRSYVLHVIEEWYDDTMVPKFEELVNESGLNIDEIGSVEKESSCIPEFVKPEGITDDEMIDYIADHTLFKRQDVIQQIEGGRDLDIFYFDIKRRENN